MPISNSAGSELVQLLNSDSAVELIPELARQSHQVLIEAEVTAALGADSQQSTDQPRGHSIGSCVRLLIKTAGKIQLRIPRFRNDSLLPSMLDPRRLAGREL
jgi:transposase-like protein